VNWLVRSRRWRLLLVGGWAVAEATVWPIMPDAVLVPLAAGWPADWRWLVLATGLGSTLGGLFTYAAGRLVDAEMLLAHQPLVRPAMVQAAREWLEADGPAGACRQPLTGVPLRVVALQAAALGTPIGPFLAWAALARGSRFVVVGALAALLGRRCAPLVRRRPRALALLWSTLFLIGLQVTVRRWERRDGPRR
jgi:1-acyl-sn-glycerol-3-phosphate acyltransferase